MSSSRFLAHFYLLLGEFINRNQSSALGPSPRITNEQFNEVITRCVSRILAVFDDSVQFGLVKLRLNEVTNLSGMLNG